MGVTVKVEGSRICGYVGGGDAGTSSIVMELELFERLCFLPHTSDMRLTLLMNPR